MKCVFSAVAQEDYSSVQYLVFGQKVTCKLYCYESMKERRAKTEKLPVQYCMQKRMQLTTATVYRGIKTTENPNNRQWLPVAVRGTIYRMSYR